MCENIIMIKGLIFDLDGTLIDSIKDITTSANLALKDYNYPTQNEDIVRLHTGNGFRKLIKELLPIDSNDELIDEVTKVYTNYYAKHYMDETSSYEGIYELLRLLQKENIKIAVNSNKKNEYTTNLMKKIFDDIEFVATIGERENIKNKPDPTSALEIINLMKLNKDEVMYVGDSEIDMKTGLNAGIKICACLWGFRTKEELEIFKPDVMVNKPIEIYNYIKETNK